MIYLSDKSMEIPSMPPHLSSLSSSSSGQYRAPGANTMNILTKMASELQLNVPTARVKVYAPHERHLTACISGSV